MTRCLFSGFLLVFLALTAMGQEPFPREEPKPFPPGVRESFSGLDRVLRAEALALADSLQQVWDNGGFSESQKDTINGAVERLLGGHYQPWPDLGNYLRVVLYISAQPDANRLFARWHQALAHSMQTQTPARTAGFIDRSAKLFLGNILFRSGSVTWKIRNARPVYDFRNNESFVWVSGADLICLAYSDSSVVYQTSGMANLDKNYWEGQGGRFTWQRTLLPPDRVFAELSRLRLDLTKANFEADSVTFYHLDFFDTPLQGRIRERVVAEFRPDEANFPVFESYQRQHVIRDVFPGINYYGGFVLQGSRVQGAGDSGDAALIEVFSGDDKIISARSKNFVIRPDRILSDRASFTIYLGRDSIFQPNLSVRYLNEQRELSAIRDERGLSRAPFFNTFHRLDMYCEALYWKLDSSFMTFQMIRGVGQPREAVFESHDFFSQARYNRAQGIDDINPLSRLSAFARSIGTPVFYLNEYSRFLRREPAVVKQDLFNLSSQGFILFDEDDGRITLTERLYHYLSANARSGDFDVIQIRSVAPVNARFDLASRELELFGVERIPLSTTKNVVIHPLGGRLTMHANRNMAFDGLVESGLFNFYGKEFFFEYEPFKITMVNSDSMTFRVRSFEPDSRGRFELVKVKNVLEGINGELLVDHPYNKSGRLFLEYFPVFNSFNESFVFYDNEEIYGGAYGRDATYFRIEPFTIEYLDRATTDNISFGGVFYSGGILPEIKGFLTVQSDYTLGFTTETPLNGLPVYDGLVNYVGPIQMGINGLQARGRMEYLASVIEAENVVLLPNEARGTARNFELAPGGEADYPAIQAQNVNISLRPAENNLRIAHTREALTFYDGRATFKGDVELTPSSLSGTGQLEVQQATIHAGDFVFRQTNLVSQRSDMEVIAPTGRQAFVHRHFSAEVDMENLRGSFRPADVDALISFPAINLLAQGYDYDWDIEKGLIDMRSAGRGKLPSFDRLTPEQLLEVDFSGYEMVFTDRIKDSLRFYAPVVNLELKDYNLKAEGVPLLRVADAAIFPDQGILNVDAGGIIRRMENARIIANTETRHHKFFRASVEVTSSKQYRASGYYTYVDKQGKTRDVFFERIGVDPQQKTFGQASLPDSLGFSLSPQFAFSGKVNLKADEQFLHFDGFSKIDVSCPGLATGWFSFSASINPNDVKIPVAPGLHNPDRREINVAVMLAGDSLHIYPAIFMRRNHHLDRELFSAYGYLVYDDSSGDYLITAAEKLADRNLPHNMLRINTRNCIIQGEGVVDLGVDLGQFKMENFGTITHNLQTSITDLELVMGLNFFFSDRVMNIFASSAKSPENPYLNLNSQKFRKYLALKTGPENASLLINELLSSRSFHRLPPALNHTILLGDVRLRWHQPTRSFVSHGPIGLAALGQNQVIKQMVGNMEIRKLRGGDTFTLLFRAAGSTDAGIGSEWYYFHMGNDMLTVLSSFNEFNEAVRQLRPRQREMKRSTGERPFSFGLAQERRPYDFFHVMRQIRIN